MKRHKRGHRTQPAPLAIAALLVMSLAISAAACGTGESTDGSSPTPAVSPSASAASAADGDAGSAAAVEGGSGELPVLGPSPDSFSFVVTSDTVAPGYLPFTESQWELMQSLIGPMTGYTAGDPGSGVVAEPTFADGGGLLTHLSLAIPGRAAREIDYRAGWPVRVVEVDGGVSRQTFRRAGQTWVYESVADALEPGGAAFGLHAGDLSFWGLQGRAAEDSPYWSDLRKRLLDRVAPARLQVGAVSAPGSGVTGLDGRVVACVGNHETWGDPELEGMRGALPALEGLGFAADRPVWAFDFGGTRFIGLDSEAFVDAGGDARPLDHAAQMALLREWLDGAAEAGLDRAVVLYHRPSFTLGRVGGLPAATDPHLVLREYADRLDVLVFNGHVHTTEAFEVEGVRYVVCGAGGSEQELVTRVPRAGYPLDSYWAGAPREEEYAWVEVRVDGDDADVLVHRWRPSAPDLAETVELFGG